MGHKKPIDYERSAYVQHALREYLRSSGMSQAEFARKAKVSAPAINQVVNRAQGVGMGMLSAVVEALGLTLAELEDRSRAWAKERREAGLLTVPDVRAQENQPNFNRAVEYAKRKELASERVLHVAERMARQSPYDLPMANWVNLVQSLAISEDDETAEKARSPRKSRKKKR